MAEKKKENKWAGIIEIIMQPISSFFGEIVKGKVIEIKESTLDALYRFKAQVLRSAVEGFLLLAGLAALLVGAMMYLSRYIALDILLLVFGLIVVFGVILTAKLKPSTK